MSKLKTVLAVVEDATEPLTPKQVYDIVSKKMYITRSTVRKYLIRLKQENRIVQPHTGYYCSKVTYNVIVGELRVHNLWFHVRANFLRQFEKIDDITEFVGDVKIFIQFGKQRRLLSGKISIKEDSHSRGMVKDTLLFALNRVFDWMEHETNQTISEGIVLTRFETNRDYPGKRLDGKITCLTKKQLFDVIERVYQKDDDTLRTERVATVDMAVEEAVSLLRGNLPDINTAQGLMVLTKRVDGLNTRIGYGNREVFELKQEFVDLKKSLSVLTKSLNDILGNVSANGKNGVASSSQHDANVNPSYRV